MHESIDLSNDERNLLAYLGIRPVMLSPMYDGTVGVSKHPGLPPRIMSLSELSAKMTNADGDGLSDDELVAAWKSFRSDDSPEDATDDEGEANLSIDTDEDDGGFATNAELYEALRSHAVEQGFDLAATDAAHGDNL